MDAAWLAGFFDGEGCVTAEQSPPRARVQVGQRNREILDEIAATYGGNIYRLKHGTHLLQITRAALAIAFLEAVQPHVRVKRQEVKLGLQLARLVGMTDERSLQRRNEVAAQLKVLTKRRVPEPGEPRLRYHAGV